MILSFGELPPLDCEEEYISSVWALGIKKTPNKSIWIIDVVLNSQGWMFSFKSGKWRLLRYNQAAVIYMVSGKSSIVGSWLTIVTFKD